MYIRERNARETLSLQRFQQTSVTSEKRKKLEELRERREGWNDKNKGRGARMSLNSGGFSSQCVSILSRGSFGFVGRALVTNTHQNI